MYCAGCGRQQKHIVHDRLCTRNMGLYDTPLPPRPPPRPEENKNKFKDDTDEDGDEDDDTSALLSSSTPLLFSFDVETGKEVNDLLPPLGRSLQSGVDCYFEPSDRLVLNLVRKTSCAVEDACWALEACKGDITEAWTCISTARRVNLNANRLPTASDNVIGYDNNDFDDDFEWDEDSYEVEMQEQYERLKSQRMKEQKRRNIQDMFKPAPADQNWLPKQNPRPIDDEPWFTG
ncbi:hypothetical protein ACA910_000487 [Epithemia clementina (nom. ined.)]